MRTKLTAFALILSLMSAFVFTTSTAHAAQAGAAAGVNVPISGTFPVTGGTGNFTGTLNITRFAVQNGQLVAIGTVTGTATQTINNVTTTVGQVTNLATTVPLTGLTSNGTCTILTLDLGPLHLDLLGLVVDLNAIHLTVTAHQGPGNLLGNLLCTVANLLNGNASLNAVAAILNNLLGNLTAAA